MMRHANRRRSSDAIAIEWARACALTTVNFGAPDPIPKQYCTRILDEPGNARLALLRFLRLPEVATRSGLSKATAFRILATLIAEGLVFLYAANGSFGVGAVLLWIGE